MPTRPLVTVPWDPSVGFTRATGAPPARGFVVAEPAPVALPHLFAVRYDTVQVVNLAGASPRVGEPVAVLTATGAGGVVGTVRLAGDPFTGRRIDDLVALADGGTVWSVHDDTRGEHAVARSGPDGSTAWWLPLGPLDVYQGERCDVFDLAEGILVVGYRPDLLAFTAVDPATGAVIAQWTEPRTVDRLHRAGTRLVGIGTDGAGARELHRYDPAARRADTVALDGRYHGLFGGLLGADDRSGLYLSLGDRVVRYAPDGGVAELSLAADVAPALAAPPPPADRWRVAPGGGLLLADPRAAALVVVEVTL